MYDFIHFDSGHDIPLIIQQVEKDLTECLNYNLILLREHLSSKSVDKISALTSIETEIQMLLPCELLFKLVSMAILTSHSLRLQGMKNFGGNHDLISCIRYSFRSYWSLRVNWIVCY